MPMTYSKGYRAAAETIQGHSRTIADTVSNTRDDRVLRAAIRMMRKELDKVERWLDDADAASQA